MRCREADYQLQLYIDSRLSVKQLRTLEAHVARCSACQADLALLEDVAQSINQLKPVVEPADLTERIMQRVAMTPLRHSVPRFSLLRLSLLELLTVIVLATIATFGSILGQPSLRALLPFANGHDPLSRAFMQALHTLVTIDIGTLTWALWVVGTILGICITLLLAGEEMRTAWYKAMRELLPVR